MKDPWEGFQCDTCGKPIRMGDAVYSIATNQEAKTARHWECYTPLETALAQLREKLHTAEALLKRNTDRSNK